MVITPMATEADVAHSIGASGGPRPGTPTNRGGEVTGTGPNTGGIMDRLKGKTKQVAGAVLGDQDLQEEGQLHEKKADTAKEAARLQAEAEQREAEARCVHERRSSVQSRLS